MAKRGSGRGGSKLDPQGWSWALKDQTIVTITDNHLEQVYGVGNFKQSSGRKKGAWRMPFNFDKVGMASWLNKTKRRSFLKHLQEESDADLRKEGSPLGLYNMGATCYANSLLQIWFHDVEFQQAVFAWRPPTKSSDNKDNKDKNIEIMQALQYTFAQMAASRRSAYRPDALVKSLELQPHVQQDSHEFWKLFAALVEHNFTNTGDELLEDYYRRQTGAQAYQTTCQNCKQPSSRPDKFLELEVNIQNYKRLEESLESLVSTERLEGDNKYFCSNCNEKYDATRGLVLTSLPDTLSIQLMRFVYDFKTFNKKKVTKQFNFPSTLDMAPFLEGVDELQAGSEHVYELCAVLLHRGATANSGHYMAQIRHPESHKWYFCNDEHSVRQATTESGHLVSVDPSSKTVAGATDKPQKPSKNDGKGRYSSSLAYLLVYRRQATVAKHKTMGRPMPPAELLQQVEADNTQLTVAKDKAQADRAKLTEGVEEICSHIEASALALNPELRSNQDLEWVPKSWLLSWFKQDIHFPVAKVELPTATPAMAQDDEIIAVEDDDLEEAKRLSEADQAKADKENEDLTRATANSLNSKGSSEPEPSLDMEVITLDDSQPATETNDLIILTESPAKDGPLKAASEPKPPLGKLKSKADDRVWSEVPALDVSPLLCEHGRIHPDRVDKARLIPRTVVQEAVERGVPALFRMDRPLHDTLCKDCVQTIYNLEVDKRQLLAEQQKLRTFAKNHGRLPNSAAVAEAIVALQDEPVFLARGAWRKFEKLTPGSKRSPIFNSEARCTHGGRVLDEEALRLVPQKLFQAMAQHFVDSVSMPYSAPPCSQCAQERQASQAHSEGDRVQAVHERGVLGDAIKARNGHAIHELFEDLPPLTGNSSSVVETPNDASQHTPQEPLQQLPQAQPQQQQPQHQSHTPIVAPATSQSTSPFEIPRSNSHSSTSITTAIVMPSQPVVAAANALAHKVLELTSPNVTGAIVFPSASLQAPAPTSISSVSTEATPAKSETSSAAITAPLAYAPMNIQPRRKLYAVPVRFLKSWRTWTRKRLVTRPTMIDYDALLCTHRKLLFDVNHDMRADGLSLAPAQYESQTQPRKESSNFELVDQKTFIQLHEWYLNNCEGGVSFMAKNPSQYESVPEVCQSCREARLAQEAQVPLEYGSSPLWVLEGPAFGHKPTTVDAASSQPSEVVIMDDSADHAVAAALQAEEDALATKADELIDELKGTKAKRAKMEEKDADYVPSSDSLPVTNTLRSSRRSTSRSCKNKGISFRMSSSDTLISLKMKILERCEMFPKSQHLFLGNRELVGDQLTLGALQVPPSSTLELRIEFADVPKSTAGGATVEQGFKGTALVGQGWGAPSKAAQATPTAVVDDDDDDDDDAIISKESSKNAKRPSSGSVKEPQAKQERRETVYIAESPEY
eukprot:m.226627 g.226627  ORF g.226627 m.226627 type:complete len:1419 (-) comp17314_c1_seq1:82-4338(-)